MIIKRYRAKSMNEAMTRIRYELGKEAIIISQRRVRKSGFFGFFSKKILEVTAAVEKEKNKSNEAVHGSIEAIKRIMSNSEEESIKRNNLINEVANNSQIAVEKIEQKAKAPKVIYNYDLIEKSNKELIKEVQEMRNMLTEMNNTSDNKKLGKSKLQLKLENSDMNSKVVKLILEEIDNIKDDKPEEEKLKEVLKNMVKVSSKSLENIIVLVGPTGVGKTTTIAKLAGRLALIEKKKVGLITIDTYRIGAVEQLKTYADIMNIPFKVALTIKDMKTAIESMENCDVILIDTTGRSSRNAMQISELRAFVEKLNTDNIHLVISCTTKNKDIDVIVNGYKPLNYNSVIITKLDETSTYGSILNILQNTQKPISFVTTGQNVPEDLKILTSQQLINLILGEDFIC